MAITTTLSPPPTTTPKPPLHYTTSIITFTLKPPPPTHFTSIHHHHRRRSTTTTTVVRSKNSDSADVPDRLISAVCYFYPFFDGIHYGKFIITQYTFLQTLIQPLTPAIRAFKSFPFNGFLVFLTLYFVVVRNPNFSRDMDRFVVKRKPSNVASSSSNSIPARIDLDNLPWDPSERKPISSYHLIKKMKLEEHTCLEVHVNLLGMSFHEILVENLDDFVPSGFNNMEIG